MIFKTVSGLRAITEETPRELREQPPRKPTSVSLYSQPSPNDLQSTLHRKIMECDALNQQLESSVMRQQRLERELEEIKKSRLSNFIRIENEYAPASDTCESSECCPSEREIDQRQELRFYKDALLTKSHLFGKLEEMLQENQQELVRMAERNRHLEELTRHQELLIQELLLKNQRLEAMVDRGSTMTSPRSLHRN